MVRPDHEMLSISGALHNELYEYVKRSALSARGEAFTLSTPYQADVAGHGRQGKATPQR
jgi:hypothetical protein